VTEHSFDALTRSLGRRRAMQALTAAAATTLSSVTLAGAKSHNANKNKNKRKKKNREQSQKLQQQATALCVDQIAQCDTLVGDNPAGIACCQILGECDFNGFIACLRSI
jgi:hypothetical protein